MSNFYRKELDIAQGNSPIIRTTNVEKLFTKNNDNIFTVYNHTSNFTNINERPNNVGYGYYSQSTTTDISMYSIAPYKEGSNGQSLTNSEFPTWCKNIRVVMIGGGGAGYHAYEIQHNHQLASHNNTDSVQYQFFQEDNHVNGRQQQKQQINQQGSNSQGGVGSNHHKGQLQGEVHGRGSRHEGANEQNIVDNRDDGFGSQQHQNNSIYQQRKDSWNKRQWNRTHRHHNWGGLHQVTQYAAYSGGGGAAVYLTSISTQKYPTVKITSGGVSSATLLTLTDAAGGTVNITAGGGALTATGTVTAQGATIQANQITTPIQGVCYEGGSSSPSVAGVNGLNNSSGSFGTTLSYGNGGLQTTGNPGYYRVYFLTD